MSLVGHVFHRQGHGYRLEPIPHFLVQLVRGSSRNPSISQMSRPLQNSVISQRADGWLVLVTGTSYVEDYLIL